MKYREWFLYRSVSDDIDTLTAVPRGSDPLDQYANMITVVEKQAYDSALKMLDEMAGALEMIERAYPLDGDRMAHQDVALKMLDKYKQWKAGE